MGFPYTHNPELNAVVTELMKDWDNLVTKAREKGFEFKLTPNSPKELEFYFHDDYPGIILVDKDGELL